MIWDMWHQLQVGIPISTIKANDLFPQQQCRILVNRRKKTWRIQKMRPIQLWVTLSSQALLTKVDLKNTIVALSLSVQILYSRSNINSLIAFNFGVIVLVAHNKWVKHFKSSHIWNATPISTHTVYLEIKILESGVIINHPLVWY